MISPAGGGTKTPELGDPLIIPLSIELHKSQHDALAVSAAESPESALNCQSNFLMRRSNSSQFQEPPQSSQQSRHDA
jgi:hypothetical protein